MARASLMRYCWCARASCVLAWTQYRESGADGVDLDIRLMPILSGDTCEGDYRNSSTVYPLFRRKPTTFWR